MDELTKTLKRIRWAFNIYALFIIVWYCTHCIYFKEQEDIIGNDIIRYKQLYLDGLEWRFKFNKRVVGWASDPYWKCVGGEETDLGNGAKLIGTTVCGTFCDKIYFNNKRK
ncbi:MAG: hypothetical protein KF862_07505 [Chitinophagaceae bacterium]|nr:hypothetical protein [Chitinophagaceae bacterium]